MADIVHFKPTDSSAQPAPARAGHAGCEIILFPGVRYERWADAPPPAQKSAAALRKSRAKKRELELELAD